MKSLKVILTIIITILIVIVGLATEMLAIADSTILNPWFYKTPLNKLGFYDTLRDSLLKKSTDIIDNHSNYITEDYKEDAYAIIERAIPKKEFSDQLGLFFSGTVKFLLYNSGDGPVPVNSWVDSITREIIDSEISKNVVDSEIEKGAIAIEDKEFYYGEYERVNILSINQTLITLTSIVGDSTTFSEVFYNYVNPTNDENIRSYWDNNRFYTIRFWVKWAIAAFFIGLAIILILIGLLFILWRKKAHMPFKICSIILLVNSILIIIGGISMFFLVDIAASLNKIPGLILSFISIDIIKATVNPLAIMIILFGIILLSLSLLFTFIGKRIKLKNEIKIEEKTDEPVVEEIDYTTTVEEEEK